MARPIDPQSVTALLNQCQLALDHRDLAAARKMLAAYPLPRGWTVTLCPTRPRRWNAAAPRQIITQRNGLLFAGGKDWLTKDKDGLSLADQMNANPAAGQYVLRVSDTTHLVAMVAPRPSLDLGRQPHVLVGSAGNYYHSLLDYAIRLKSACTLPELRDLPILTGTDPAPFEQDLLTASGIDPQRLRPIPKATTVSFQRLHIPDLGCLQGQPHPETIGWLRDVFCPPQTASRRLWISRRDAATRRLLNEEELLPHLALLGFEVVSLDGLSIRDQAALFASAQIVAGPHGAGFTNLVFCPPTTKVVEIMPGRLNQLGFFPALSAALGLTHQRLFGTPTPSPEQRQRLDHQNWDFTLPVARILAALR